MLYNKDAVMIYTIEPGLFKIEIDKKTTLSKFTLGSLSSWSVGSGTGPYLQEISVKCCDFELPEKWDFRRGSYFINNGIWYCSRNYKLVHFKFRYDRKSNTLEFYPIIFSKIPFVFNGFYPIGLEVGNILLYEMMKKGFLPIRACAFLHKGKTVLFIAPSMNGKTRLVKDLTKGNKNTTFISDDIVLLNKSQLIGFPPLTSFIRRESRNFRLENDKKRFLFKNPDYIFYYNVSNTDGMEISKDIINFPLIETYFYFSESIISAIMYHEDTTLQNNLLDIYKHVSSCSKNYRIKTNGYNVEKIIFYLNEVIK